MPCRMEQPPRGRRPALQTQPVIISEPLPGNCTVGGPHILLAAALHRSQFTVQTQPDSYADSAYLMTHISTGRSATAPPLLAHQLAGEGSSCTYWQRHTTQMYPHLPPASCLVGSETVIPPSPCHHTAVGRRPTVLQGKMRRLGGGQHRESIKQTPCITLPRPARLQCAAPQQCWVIGPNHKEQSGPITKNN